MVAKSCESHKNIPYDIHKFTFIGRLRNLKMQQNFSNALFVKMFDNQLNTPYKTLKQCLVTARE